MPFRIIRDDLTKIHADAIVNTANPDPAVGGGTDSAVYEAAGYELLLAERRKIGAIAPGEAAVTEAFALPAKYIIHTVGPRWQGGAGREKELLSSCYRKSLLLAKTLGCESIAFPLISSGTYGFPKDEALECALGAFRDFLQTDDMEIILAVFDRKAFELSAGLVETVSSYIDEHYVAEKSREEYRIDSMQARPGDKHAMQQGRRERRRNEARANIYEDAFFELPPEDASIEPRYEAALLELQEEDFAPRPPEHSIAAARPAASAPQKPAPKPPRDLKDVIGRVGENFQEMLLRMIDERHLTDTEVYKKANLDRKLFSKIRCNPAYLPKKRTALALAFALELNLDETTDLIRRAGIALSPGSEFDLIIQYCIENHIYDLFTVNALLFDYDQPLLGQ